MTLHTSALDQIRELERLLPELPPDTHLADLIAASWIQRMADSARAILELDHRGLGQASVPIWRTILELLVHVTWLSRAEDQQLAVKALALKNLQQEIIRLDSSKGQDDAQDGEIDTAIEERIVMKNELEEVGPGASSEHLKRYCEEVKNFERMTASVDEANFVYTAFRYASAESHATLEVARQQSMRLSRPEATVQSHPHPPLVVLALVIAVREASKHIPLLANAPQVLDSAEGWFKDNRESQG